MENLRFTLFNAITVFMMALTGLVVWRRFAGKLSSNWPLGYDAVLVGYTIGFSGGLNPYWVAAAVACGLLIRFGFYPDRVRLAELIPLAYVMWRCVGLVLMW